MSRARVIVGRTHDGYPVSRWQDTPADDARYGFMEPASQPTITTRKATPAELAAANAEPVGYLDAKPGRRQSTGPVGGWDGMATPERMAASRARGAARTHAATRPISPHQKRVLSEVRAHGGNRSHAAIALGVSTTAIQTSLRLAGRVGVTMPEPATRYGIPNKVPFVPGSPLRAAAPDRAMRPEARPSRHLREVHPLHAAGARGAEAMKQTGGAMTLLQGTDEWLEARRALITATDVPVRGIRTDDRATRPARPRAARPSEHRVGRRIA
jgi:hypothetical protein